MSISDRFETWEELWHFKKKVEQRFSSKYHVNGFHMRKNPPDVEKITKVRFRIPSGDLPSVEFLGHPLISGGCMAFSCKGRCLSQHPKLSSTISSHRKAQCPSSILVRKIWVCTGLKFSAIPQGSKTSLDQLARTIRSLNPDLIKFKALYYVKIAGVHNHSIICRKDRTIKCRNLQMTNIRSRYQERLSESLSKHTCDCSSLKPSKDRDAAPNVKLQTQLLKNRRWLRTYLTRRCQQPLVFSGQIDVWAASTWSPKSFINTLHNQKMRFRIGRKIVKVQQLETECLYEWATTSQFHEWVSESQSPDNPLAKYSRSEYWCYADYKYMEEMFKSTPKALQCIDWSVFGFDDRDGRQSTFWMGSEGSNTVGHYDTYGCNLVAQVYGRKRWVLFPSDQTPNLYPTRVPYEESSVFSQVNIRSPDLKKHPLFKKSTPFVVELQPGQVLFVPRHWWHFVESLDTTISINSWIELPEDHEERFREAVARTLAFSIMDQESDMSWLNPTESPTEHEDNLEFIQGTLIEPIGLTGESNNTSTTSMASHTTHYDSQPDQGIIYTTTDEIYSDLKRFLSAHQPGKTDTQAPTEGDIKLEIDKLNVCVPRSSTIDTLPYSYYSDLDRDLCAETRAAIADIGLVGCGSRGKSHVTSVDVMDCLLQPDVIKLVCEKLKSKLSS